MYASSNRRGHHRKRLSALRLSSDSTVTTLPLYTSPPRSRLSELSDVPLEQPPAYPDSAEEADEDTDSTNSNSDSEVVYVPSPPPSLPVSPRRPRRLHARSHSSSRRQNSVAHTNDPYLDSLLARSVHALEMSNTLLQSSMSTQTSLSAVLADDAVADRHLEERTRKLTSRIRSNRDMHEAWMDDLEEISRGVEGLVRGEDISDDDTLASTSQRDAPISQSLPTSSLEQRMGVQSRSRRRASQDFRQHQASGSSSNLQLSVHDRSHFIAPAPRAITMYIDSSEAADLISLPSTLGVRSDTRPPPTPLPNQTVHTPATSELDTLPASAPVEQHPKRAADMLASYVMPRSSVSSSPPFSRLRRRSSSSSAATVKRSRVSKSPPPPIRIDASSSPSSSAALRSRSSTPCRESPVQRQLRSLTPPIEELSTSSASSESATLHVDRTVESLRQILEKQRTASQSSGKPASAQSVPTISRPSLLSPPVAPPTSGTSTATASVSRLFTKPRYTTSTRAPSPPKQSSLKKASQPSTPVTPSPSPSLLSVPDLLGLGGRTRSSGSSGASTPKRISFAEPPESYSSTKPEGSSSKFRAVHKTRSKPNSGSGSGRGRDAKGKGKGKARDDEGDGENLTVGWWASWLLGATAADSGSAIAPGAGRSRSEERYASFTSPRAAAAGGTWSMRPGFGSSIEEWGA